MLYGNARVTVLSPDRPSFIGDITDSDLWFFPSGYPHSIQDFGPDGCEFLLVFDEGTFSEYTTFLISGWLSHTPRQVLAKNCKLTDAEVAKLPEQEGLEAIYIFPRTVPGPLEADRAVIGGAAVASKVDYTFRMKAMKPTIETASLVAARLYGIPNFGFLANRQRVKLLPLCFRLLQQSDQPAAGTASPIRLPTHSPWNCPLCGGTMQVVERLSPAQLFLRSPPHAGRCAP